MTEVVGALDGLSQGETERQREALEQRFSQLHQAVEPLPPTIEQVKEAAQTVGVDWA